MTTEDLRAGDLLPLRPIAAQAATLVRALAQSPSLARRTDLEYAGTAGTTATNAAVVRHFLQSHGWVATEPGREPALIATVARLLALAERLRGMADADELSVPPPVVEPVVTLSPSSRLASILAGEFDAHATRDGFAHVAANARERLSLLVPFGDAEGAELLVEMLSSTPARIRRIYVRPDSQKRKWYEPYRTLLTESGAELIEYWIRMPNGRYETFHAKIAVADERLAYVGSSNFLSASLGGGLECGVLLEGDLVRPWVQLVQALDAVCADRR